MADRDRSVFSDSRQQSIDNLRNAARAKDRAIRRNCFSGSSPQGRRARNQQSHCSHLIGVLICSPMIQRFQRRARQPPQQIQERSRRAAPKTLVGQGSSVTPPGPRGGTLLDNQIKVGSTTPCSAIVATLYLRLQGQRHGRAICSLSPSSTGR